MLQCLLCSGVLTVNPASVETVLSLQLSCCTHSLFVVFMKRHPEETNKCVFQQQTDTDLILVAPRGGDLEVKGEPGTGGYECAFDFIKRRRI